MGVGLLALCVGMWWIMWVYGPAIVGVFSKILAWMATATTMEEVAFGVTGLGLWAWILFVVFVGPCIFGVIFILEGLGIIA